MKSVEILNDPGLLQARDRHFGRLEQVFAGIPGEQAFVLCGITGRGQSDLYTAPEDWMHEALDDLAARAEALGDPEVFRPLSISPWPFGVHFVDTLFEARVYELADERENWQSDYLRTPVGRLAAPDLTAQPAFKLAQRLTQAFIQAAVKVPLFAPPVLSSPLNIAVNLYGQEFLVALLGEPAAARRDLRVITNTIKALHNWFRKAVPFQQLQMIETCGRIQPPGHGQVCGCSTQLLSAGQYREFIAPLDEEILALYQGGGMIHLCGSHTQHLGTWKAMSALCAVQLNDRAAEDLELFLAGLRSDQVLYVNPCPGMPVDQILGLTGGRRTVIAGDITLPVLDAGLRL